jgi:hypothetical protein
MKLHAFLLLALLPLLSARPSGKKAPFWEVNINNFTGPYWIHYEVKFYDAATGTVYGDETFKVAAGDSYETDPYLIQGAQPTIYISWSTAPTAATMTYNTKNPDGAYVPNGITCHAINKLVSGSMVYSAGGDANGYGIWNVTFNTGSGCP